MDRHSSSTPNSGDQIINVLQSSLQGELNNLHKVSPDRCIYRVPRHLQMANEGAYTPLIVSIGPLHHSDDHLLPSEIHKLNYFKSFLDRSDKTGPGLRGYLKLVKEHEGKIRGYYADPMVAEVPNKELIKMVLVDAAFLIELFSRGFNSTLIKDDDQMFNSPRMVVKVSHDICLEENQLPFFILYELYKAAGFKQASPLTVAERFLSMVCRFLRIRVPPGQPHLCRHLLDLLRIDFLPSTPRGFKTKDHQNGKKPAVEHDLPDLALNAAPPAVEHDLPLSVAPPATGHAFVINLNLTSNMDIDVKGQNENNGAKKSITIVCKTATVLREAGVRFATRPCRLLDIKFDPNRRTLLIPKLVVQDDTEVLFKNLAVFEQCHYYQDSYIIDYITFMDSLINTKEDVALLVKEGIIESFLGSDERVADMFNGLGKHLSLRSDNFYYAEQCNQLDDYYNQPCHHHLAVLRQKYFNHPWATISVVYAIVLLILTVLQAATGVIQILPSKKS